MADESVNILNVNMSIDPITGGGTAARTVQMSKALASMGNRCTILALDVGVSDDLRFQMACAQVELLTLPCLFRRYYIPALKFKLISRAVKSSDIVHLMGHWTLLNFLVFIAIRIHKKPYFVCPAGALPLFGRSKVIKTAYNFFVGNNIIRSASGYIAITEHEKHQFESYGVDSRNVDVIPNGINLEDFRSNNVADLRDAYQLGDKPFILFVGRLNPIKGPDLLLSAYLQLGEKVRNYNLVFAGPDGGLQQDLLETIRDHQVQNNVFFVGYLDGDRKSDLFHAADFLVIPSRQEAMSIVALEAGACSTPILLTEECGFNEIESVGGGLVVSATVNDIATGLSDMIERNNHSVMGQYLFDYVKENFTWDDVAMKIDRIYRRVIHRL
ncbi:hypothetical protein AX279_13060 [Pseudomonas sp. J237]|nr:MULTISPECIES: glycosyltransferase [Pseudomonas]OEO25423.1 hypothetical protein AX279_13060 [Pseudomonas sp. J237]